MTTTNTTSILNLPQLFTFMVAEATRVEKLSTPSKKVNEMNEIHGGNGMRDLRGDLRHPTGLLLPLGGECVRFGVKCKVQMM